MTLGTLPIAMSDVAGELDLSLPLAMRHTQALWLADVTSGPISMSDFENKTAIKIVDSVSANPTGTGHTFAGVNFGTAFAGRILVACICLEDNSESVLDQVSATIAGGAATGADNGQALSGGPALGAGIWFRANTSDTSGSVAIDWDGDAADTAYLIMLSMKASALHDTVGASQGSSPGTSLGHTIDIPSDGVLITAAAHYNTNNTTLTGVTEQTEVTVGGAVRFTVGFNNHMGSQTGRSVSSSWSGSVARAIRSLSFT